MSICIARNCDTSNAIIFQNPTKRNPG